MTYLWNIEHRHADGTVINVGHPRSEAEARTVLFHCHESGAPCVLLRAQIVWEPVPVEAVTPQ